MDKNNDMEIGETGKRAIGPVARSESVAIAGARGTTGSSLRLDGSAEQLAQPRLDLRVARRALPPPPRQRTHSLRHVAMPAGAADIREKTLHRLAGIVAVHAVIAHADHELAFELARDRDPRYAFELQAEVRHLHDQVVALDG